ncbi:MAG: 50S ribosomal protein L6 [Chloroflexi bacterium]|nr:50S ribosomal protein L6 [Chloroflexota bacterium]
MSRVGQAPVNVPREVEIKIEEHVVMLKGPRGELSRTFHPDMTIVLDGNQLRVQRPTDSKGHRALHGLTRSLLANMVEGVTKGFERGLEITGVGYRAQKVGEKLSIQLGYSRPVEVEPLPGVSLSLESPTRVQVSGTDKEKVGQMAAMIRGLRPLDPYKGKGIKYAGEQARRKSGKAGRKVQ